MFVRGRLTALALGCAGCLTVPAKPVADAPVEGAMIDAGTCLGSVAGGTHEDTRMVGGEIVLTAGAGAGTWTSELLGGDRERELDVLHWIGRAPYGKALPDDNGIEIDYMDGAVDMTGNVLLLHLDDDEDATSLSFTDDSGAGNGGTCFDLSCPTRAVDGMFAHAVEFDRPDLFGIQVPDAVTLRPAEATVAVWMRPDGEPWPGQNSLMALGKGFNGAHPFASYSISFTGGNRFRCYMTWDDGTGDGDYVELESLAFPDPGWTHVACVKHADTAALWVNGVMVREEAAPGPLMYGIFANEELRVGSRGVSNNVMNGALDEVAIWDRALDATAIAALHRRGALRLGIQLRTCDETCGEDPFHGPSDAISSAWSDICFDGLAPPSVVDLDGSDCDLANGLDLPLAPARHVQLQVRLTSTAPGLSPALRGIQICE